jgi:hypothetical protein
MDCFASLAMTVEMSKVRHGPTPTVMRQTWKSTIGHCWNAKPNAPSEEDVKDARDKSRAPPKAVAKRSLTSSSLGAREPAFQQ